MAATKRVTVKIGRVDSLKEVAVAVDATVEDALKVAHLTLSESEKINTLEGETVELDEEVSEDETYVIVQNYKQGTQ